MKLSLTFLIMRRASVSRVQRYILYNRNVFRHGHLSPIYSSQQKNGAADHLTFEGGGGGFFLPDTSGDRMFFADMQSHCVADIFFARVFFARNQSAEYCFLKHPFPLPSKVKWLAPNRPLQQLLKLSFCVRSIVIDDFQQPARCK